MLDFVGLTLQVAGGGTCHTMAGLGTAVRPDLKKFSSVVGPKGLVMTIRMTMTAYVEEVKSSKGTFAGGRGPWVVQ